MHALCNTKKHRCITHMDDNVHAQCAQEMNPGRWARTVVLVSHKVLWRPPADVPLGVPLLLVQQQHELPQVFGLQPVLQLHRLLRLPLQLRLLLLQAPVRLDVLPELGVLHRDPGQEVPQVGRSLVRARAIWGHPDLPGGGVGKGSGMGLGAKCGGFIFGNDLRWPLFGGGVLCLAGLGTPLPRGVLKRSLVDP